MPCSVEHDEVLLAADRHAAPSTRLGRAASSRSNSAAASLAAASALFTSIERSRVLASSACLSGPCARATSLPRDFCCPRSVSNAAIADRRASSARSSRSTKLASSPRARWEARTRSESSRRMRRSITRRGYLRAVGTTPVPHPPLTPRAYAVDVSIAVGTTPSPHRPTDRRAAVLLLRAPRRTAGVDRVSIAAATDSGADLLMLIAIIGIALLVLLGAVAGLLTTRRNRRRGRVGGGAADRQRAAATRRGGRQPDQGVRHRDVPHPGHRLDDRAGLGRAAVAGDHNRGHGARGHRPSRTRGCRSCSRVRRRRHDDGSGVGSGRQRRPARGPSRRHRQPAGPQPEPARRSRDGGVHRAHR